eukprot:6460640-Amphidinium_carterae.1
MHNKSSGLDISLDKTVQKTSGSSGSPNIVLYRLLNTGEVQKVVTQRLVEARAAEKNDAASEDFIRGHDMFAHL